jgi:hypothetical protein
LTEAFPGNGRLARTAGIYLCHRFSGAKLNPKGVRPTQLTNGLFQGFSGNIFRGKRLRLEGF